MSNIILQRETASIAEIANQAIMAVREGEIDPLLAHYNVSKMEAAIKAFKENPHVKAITLDELSKYGYKKSYGDCLIEQIEAGTKYDYSGCNDSELTELEALKADVEARIKARQATLKSLPLRGLADPETGEMIYPPVKSSKTSIKTTFKKS